MITSTLQVPYIAELDSMTADDIISTLDECGVRRMIDSLNWSDRFPYRPLTTFAMAHTATALYIDFFVRCNYLRAVNWEPNSPVYEDSSVAMSLQPNVVNDHYITLEVNCIGTLAGYEWDGDGKLTSIDPERLKRIRCVASCGNRPFRELEGLFSWNILMEVPFDFMGLYPEGQPGERMEMRGNFYKCASATSQPHFLTWIPVDAPEPTLQMPRSFGEIILD